ncbi:DEAD/DEAH box helicase [Desulfoscipio geothermicus]|uniref:Superfamily II DNA or RNA helicase, SNF2 family n=1 Tax=Desulfoscipio geothermicus DSM 3669 TaxID=1121426 RepID=A0A1I6DE23_9FIRM|nr:DEAD/DEAH box helicase [Desulfoscipio geothermicus]SFR03684.1 Superfamily II DNA or RNA helicase, SNF2 family [Desulfoscipio geothermicus DSM 3669]
MFYITDEIIRKAATNNQVYQRGLDYYLESRVVDLDFYRDELCVLATVSGSLQYEVEVCFSNRGEIIEMFCDCPAFYEYEGACKHIVAVLKACQRSFGGGTKKAQKDNQQNNPLADSIFAYFNYSVNSPEKKPVNLEITFELFIEIHNRVRQAIPALSLRMGDERLYVVKKIDRLFETLASGEKLVFGKNFTFDPVVHDFSPGDKPVINLLREMYEVENSIFEDTGYYIWRNNQGRLFRGKYVFLTQAAAKRVLSFLRSGEFNLKIDGEEYKNIEKIERDLPLHFKLGKHNDDLVLRWNKLRLVPLVKTGEYFFYEGKIYKISDRQKDYFLPFVNAFTQSSDGIRFSKQQRERFVAELLPVVRQIGRVDIAPEVKSSFHETDLKAEIYLDKNGDAVTAKVEFAYGDIRFNPFAAKTGFRAGDKILVRDVQKERAVLNLLEKAEFRTLSGNLYLNQEEAICEFVYHILPELQELAEVFYSDSFRNMRVRDSATFSGGVRLNEDSGMLEFSFELEGIDSAEIREVFQSLREKKKYYRLKDGSFLLLDSAGANLYQAMNMIDSLNISDRELEKKVIQIPKYRALYIDRCLRESNLRVERNLAFKQLVQNVTEPQDMEFEVPKNFKGVLRDYQKTGFKWLKTLAMYGLGGILADDMGLGKTVQTLAFIMSERERVPAPALVVAPTSVVYNWQDEAEKFAPDLKVVVVSGTPKERAELLKEAKKADLVITSYALIRRDVELYEDFNFGYCFLDEAQHIKNPNSLGAKAVKIIKARGYFALTGTPLENSLTELWSVFDFVMRGYLLSHQKFVKKYERPVVKEQDEKALQELQKQIAPFILRRMKRDVLQELPPKIESRVLTELTKEQKKVYLTYLQKARGEIEEAITTRGFEKSQIKILSVLTRLRQICCHPATFLENYKGDSGKLVYLREIMQDAVKGGHRILLFSQFTGMLEIIRNQLDNEQISYFYLDGSTKTDERGRMVQSFNRGEGDVFLISLKAGGTGLNLTGADMVIHYDPWWNPAVEEQATDRAHRIGQKNSVQVVKLISKGTIEEKIYELQQKKKAMIDSVIQPGETMFSKLTEQELRELFHTGDGSEM